MSLVLFNGEIVERFAVKIDFEDRGYQFGDGIYEVVRVYNGKPYLLTEHIDRLYASAEKIMMQIPYEKSELEQKLRTFLQQSGAGDCNLYIQYTRGIAPRRHDFEINMTGNLIAYCLPGKSPVREMETGVKTVLAEDIRWLRCDIKSISLLGNVLLKQEAKKKGGFEAILHRGETVTEGSSSNIWIVKDGVLKTHPANQYILNGITRQRIIYLCDREDIDYQEVTFTVSDLFAAEEAFLTSTTAEVTPITLVDDTTIGTGEPGPVTRKLQQLLREDIAQACGTVSLS